MNQKKILSIAIMVVVVIGITAGVFSYAAYSPEPVLQQPQKPLPKTQIILSENPDIELHDTPEELTELQKSAILVVQNYRGDDASGKSVSQILDDIVTSKFSDEVIQDPKTKIGWAAFSNEENPGLVGVSFSFESAEDSFAFVWYVNSESGSITPVTDGARELMDIVERNNT